jgi:ABC-2 type transport system ATP-binding protein
VNGIVIAEEVSKRFVLQHTRTWAVKDAVLGVFRTGLARTSSSEVFDALDRVSFAVRNGESVALVGRNGSGKSTLLKLIAGIHHATAGRLLVRSGVRIATLIELGVGFHPDLTGRENVYLSAAIHGLSRDEIDTVYPKVVEYAELARFIDTPIKAYSSGMVMRLGFSIAVNLNPDVFLLDEIFAVGDESFQQKCLESMRRFRSEGRTMFFVSHSADAVREMCDRSLVLEHGRLMFDGHVEAGIRRYRRILGEEPSLETVDPTAGLPEEERVKLGRGTGWHRLFVGGETWDEAGTRHLSFLREQGLKPSDHLLDLGCGCLRTGVHLIPYLEEGHYVGVDHEAAMLEAGLKIEAPLAGIDPSRGHYYVSRVTDLSRVDGQFDVIFANGLLQDLPLEAVARMFAAAIPKLTPQGRFYVAYFEAPGPVTLEPIERPGPAYSTFEGPLRHFDFETLRRLAEACGARAERLGEWGDPHGQTMMVITR